MSYDKLTPKYKAYITTFSTIVESTTYEKASKDQRWIEAMEAEIAALEDNHTGDIVSLPVRKNSIGYK